MSSNRSGQMNMWISIGVVVIALVSFSGGYLLGNGMASGKSFMVVDDYGRQIKLSGVPERIVSVAPTPTEILFAVGAGAQVVGVDDYSDYPNETSSIPKVGAWPISVEAIVALKPDLILTGDLVEEKQLNILQGRGFPYVVVAARTVADAIRDVRFVGAITGHADEANDLADSLEVRMEAVTAKTMAANVSAPKVYLEYFGPPTIFTFGPGSYGNDLIRLAGGINIASNTSSEYPQISSEFVMAGNPDIIIYTVGVMTTTNASNIAERAGWDEIKAVADGRILWIEENLVVRYGPRLLDALEQIAEMIHPELFP